MTIRTWMLLAVVLCVLGILWYHTWREKRKILRSPRVSDVIQADRLTTDHLIDEATKNAIQTAKEIKQLRQRLEDTNGT